MIPAGRRRYWVAGTLLAFVGVGIARLLTKVCGHEVQPYVRLLGVLLALGGLVVIMLGTRRKT
jgi:hypothetical protein